MNDDFISERTLERLRLGELDGEQSQRLLAALEARGELHRFEALIAEDEEFTTNHPPAMLAARVREDVRRRARSKSHTKDQPMLSKRTISYPLGLAFGLTLLAAIAAVWGGEGKTIVPVESSEIGASDGTTDSDEKTAIDETMTPAFSVVVLDFKTEYELPNPLYIALGQIVVLSTTHPANVENPFPEVVTVAGSDTVLYLEAESLGFSNLLFSSESGASLSTKIIVGEKIDRMKLHESEPSMITCRETAGDWDGIANLTIVANASKSYIASARFPGLEAGRHHDLQWCLGSVVDGWEPLATELSVGSLHFNFGSAATCEPGKDC